MISIETGSVLLCITLGVGAVLYYIKTSNSYKLVKTDPLKNYTIEVDLSKGALEKELIDKWSKPLEETPVHLDLPRLARKMEIKSNGTVVWSFIEDELSETPVTIRQTQVVSNIITSLAEVTESSELVSTMYTKVDSYFDSSNPRIDVGKRVLEFLVEVVGDDKKMIRILKACTQSIIAPAVVRLKSVMVRQFPYKDVRNGWRINIDINTDQVVVIHRKWERSFEDDSFQFRWELKMTFDGEMTSMTNTEFKIIEMIYGKNDTAATKSELKKLLRDYNAWENVQ